MNNIGGFEVYPDSIRQAEGCTVCMVKTPQGDSLLVQGGQLGFEGQEITRDASVFFLAPLTHFNAQRMRRLLPFTAPRVGLEGTCSMGVGDRLGIATPGHLRVFKRYPGAFPILAQQSIRELTLTQRGYEDVLDAASFAVMREGFTTGFGADGDHLKKAEELEYAIRCGFSMITLDCSEHIRNDIKDMSDEGVLAAYGAGDELMDIYLGREFQLGEGLTLRFEEMEFKRTALIYLAAVDFMADIYTRYIKDREMDFEISIDETLTPTNPLQHFFVANELKRRGVVCQSLAPRFCGEFQKGIDYIGDIAQFERELEAHAIIARHFGYKVSVHSGSDKFSVFALVGRYTQGVFHLKTAGTNWLEAVRLVAIKDTALYRRMHAFALENFEKASAYYHVKAKPDMVPSLASLSDDELPGLMDQEDARQLLHITYGLILTAANPDGTSRFRDDLYALWTRHAPDYAALLDKHIGRHLSLLLESPR